MSRQLALSSAFSVFALAALALLGPGSAPPGKTTETGAPIAIAAPAFSVELPLLD